MQAAALFFSVSEMLSLVAFIKFHLVMFLVNLTRDSRAFFSPVCANNLTSVLYFPCSILASSSFLPGLMFLVNDLASVN